MTTITKKIIVTVEDIFNDYIAGAYWVDDFRNMSEQLWFEILPEIEEYFIDKGMEFQFTSSDIPMLKTRIDSMFDEKFGREE